MARPRKNIVTQTAASPTFHDAATAISGEIKADGCTWLKHIGFKQEVERQINVLASANPTANVVVTVVLQ